MQLGLRDPRRSSAAPRARTGGSSAGGVAEPVRGSRSAARPLGAAASSSRACTTRQRAARRAPPPRPGAATSREPDRVVDRVGLARAAAAERTTARPTRAHVHGAHDARPRPARPRPSPAPPAGARRAPRADRPGPPSSATIAREALGRRAAVERPLGGRARRRLVGLDARRARSSSALSASVTSRRRASLAAPVEVVDRLAHLDARCRPCGRARGPCRSAAPTWAGRCPRATSTIAARQLVGLLAARAGRRPSRPSRPSPARAARRRASSTGSRRRSAGSTRRCPSRRGSRTGGGRRARARAVWPTIAQPALAHRLRGSARSGRGVVAGDRLELVERAAGVAEPAAGDHRHGAAAGGHDRREQQADLVAHPAGRVLVEHRAGQAGVRPVEHVARVASSRGEGDPLLGGHARSTIAMANAPTWASVSVPSAIPAHQPRELVVGSARRRRACADQLRDVAPQAPEPARRSA